MRTAKLSLSQKGMIVIAIPVMFQLICVFLFSKMLEQAETTARLQYASKEVFNYSDWLGVLVLASALGGLDYKLTGDLNAQSDYHDYKKAIPRELDLLRSVAGETPAEREHFDKVKVTTNALLASLEHDTNGGVGAAALPNLNLQQIWKSWRTLDKERRALINEYKRNHVLRPEDLPKVQEEASHFVVFGVISTILGAFALFWIFSKGVTERLAVLTENAARLTRRQSLNPLVAGHDEISHLDEVFHQTAEALLVAEQQKQEFVDMISHDLRTPLAALQGLLALVAAGVYGTLSTNGSERVMYAEQDLLRLIKLINELLDVEKMSAGMLEIDAVPIALSVVISQAVESVRALSEAQANELIARPTEVRVSADRDRLVQVVVNFLSNAIKYSPPGSPIEIATERCGDKVRVSVKDQGCGIPENDRELVFDRFKQVKRPPDQRRSGTGLGLAICKAIIDAHGGDIGIDSREGEGSTFWFEIPDGPHHKSVLDNRA